MKKGNTAAELSNKLKIPLSSVYKKLSDLEELTLIEVEKWMLSDKGRKYKVYRSRIKQAEIFKEICAIDSLIVTKLDGTAKGGAIVPIAENLRQHLS